MIGEDLIRQFERTARQRPSHADVWCTLGQALLAERQFVAARHALERALELNPAYVDAALARCDLLGATGRAREGLAALRPVATRAPDAFATVFAVGVYAMRHGFTETGLAQLRRAATLQPEVPYVARFLAQALAQTGDERGARAERERARILEAALPRCSEVEREDAFRAGWPEVGRARLQIECARHLLAAGREAEARQELHRAHARFPGHADLLVELGRLAARGGEHESACAWLQGAIRVAPACDRAVHELACLDAAEGRVGAAVAGMRRAVELRPLYPDYRYALGMLLLDEGRPAEAAAQFEQALVLRPDDAHSALQLASWHARERRFAEAEALLDGGAWAQWAEGRALRIELLAAQGRYDEARVLLEGLLAELPDLAGLRADLARLPG